MELTVIATADHQLRCANAVKAGVEAVGGSVVLGKANTARTQKVCCWGWRLGKRLRDQGHDVLVMERAYLGDRFRWYSLAWNGLNGNGRFIGGQEDAGARFQQHFGNLMKPWREGGEYILLIGQVPGDASLQGMNMMPWYEHVAAQAKAIHGLPVLFRPHPVALQRGFIQQPQGTKQSFGDLHEALNGAKACVTFNSNTGVESVLYGVPTIVHDPGSMAWDVSGHDLYSITRPDRTHWANQLAWKQWTLEEIASGLPFRS